jgi:hypothetical protein
MMATGAVTAKSQPMKPLDAYRKPKSERIFAGTGGLSAGRSMCVNMYGLVRLAGVLTGSLSRSGRATRLVNARL